MLDIGKQLSKEFGVSERVVDLVLELLEVNTIPFVARYRKELTGDMDEVVLKDIYERRDYLVRLKQRKLFVLGKIDDVGKLSVKLSKGIRESVTLREVEDFYVPFKETRNTKASLAKDKGLGELAERVKLDEKGINFNKEIKRELELNKKVKDEEEVLEGIKEILKSEVVRDVEVRRGVTRIYKENGILEVKLKDIDKDKEGKFKNYYDYREKVGSIPSHRWLAIQRGVKEGVLRLGYKVNNKEVYEKMGEKWLGKGEVTLEFIDEVIKEGFDKSLKTSLEGRLTKDKNTVFGNESIEVFAENLENLLLKKPMKGEVILAIDPAYRTGCKLAIVGKQGELLGTGLIFPHAPKNEYREAKLVLDVLVGKYEVSLIAIGNGTASRETERLVKDYIEESGKKGNLGYRIVDESGASVYSASEVARREFPDKLVEDRSAVSIGRRLQDPLSELVKIDPKSVGVGQYQHDVDKKELEKALDFTVEKIVNRVGVDVNTASVELLKYVSGVSKRVAINIVDYRNENGKFRERRELKKVKGIGPKVYEQMVGFLRIYGGVNKLDETGLHPSIYVDVESLLKERGYSVGDLESKELIGKLDSVFGVGNLEGLEKEVYEELKGLGKDLRDVYEEEGLERDLVELVEVFEGAYLRGVVKNVVDFGAFIDVGLDNDGLVHISKMSNEYVKNPRDVLKVGEVIDVWVESIDKDKGRISLTMLHNNK